MSSSARGGRTPRLRFDGRIVIVTGAGRGLGREYALQFARRGARVVVNDRGAGQDGAGTETDVATSVVDEIRDAGGEAVADTHDVSVPGAGDAIVRTALDSFGRVDVVVNNAGYATFGDFVDLDPADWERMFAVTVGGAVALARAVWPHMIAQGGGRIINTTSNAGYAGCDQLSHYGAAKLAVAGLTKTLALEGAKFGIHVNAVAPVAVTRMNSEQFFGGTTEGRSDWLSDMRSGTRTIGPVESVGPTVLWLAHERCELNGEVLSSSSGRVARVAFVVGEGWFAPNHSPEQLAAHCDDITSLRRFTEPRSAQDENHAIALRHRDS